MVSVTYLQLRERLENTNRIFPVGPEIKASTSGFTTNGASGTHAVMYGAMIDNVQQLKVVGANSDIITTDTLGKDQGLTDRCLSCKYSTIRMKLKRSSTA